MKMPNFLVRCPHCNGCGREPISLQLCWQCNGSGTRNVIWPLIFIVAVTLSVALVLFGVEWAVQWIKTL